MDNDILEKLTEVQEQIHELESAIVTLSDQMSELYTLMLEYNEDK